MRNFFDFTGMLEEEQTIQEEFVLTSDDTGQIPRTVIHDGTEYVLDESSIQIRVSKTELWRDQQVLEEYVTYDVEDNDIDRLEREITKDGKVLELIGVEYSVTETTESGLPLAYAAKCRYAVNVDRDREVPVEWKATADYTGNVEEAEQEAVAFEAADSVDVSGTAAGVEALQSLPAEAEPEQDVLQNELDVTEMEEIQTIGEMEAFEEEPVPLAAAIEKPVISPGSVAAGVTGTALIGAAVFYAVFQRKRNRVSVYMSGQEGKKGKFLGKTCASVQNGRLVIPIPEKILQLPGVHFKELVLKPSGKLLNGSFGRAKIVSSAGILYAGVQDTMSLWESEA